MASWFSNIKTFINMSDRFDGLKTRQDENKQTLSHEHAQISQQLQHVSDKVEQVARDAGSLKNSVDWIRDDLNETKNRIGNMTTSEREVQASIETLENFLDSSVNLREDEKKRYELLKSRFVHFESYCHKLEHQVLEKEVEIKKLQNEVKTLTSEQPQHKPHQGYDEPTL